MTIPESPAILKNILYADPEKGAAKVKADRLGEIDLAKGIAGFLMVVSHIAGPYFFPNIGTFGAPLFFCCSGMNTYLFLKNSEKIKGINVVHILFPIILFFGGYTQIVICHRQNFRFVPEFLQLSGISIFAIFLAFKLTRKTAAVGGLFLVPFLLNFLLPAGAFHFLPFGSSVFIFGKAAFPLIPWSGYFFYGIFLLAFRKRPWILLMVTSALALLVAWSAFGLHIPIQKFSHSLSYVFLALLVISAIYAGSLLALASIKARWFQALSRGISLAGRNSLMFLYVHYFALHYFMPDDLAPFFLAALVLGSIVVFLICLFALRFYEVVRLNFALFLPTAAFMILIVWFRVGNLFYWKVADALLIDMTIGILFAFLYVQGRAIARKYLIELSKNR